MPYSNLALDADGENGPAARSFAADAHDCIMVRIRTDLPNTSVWRDVPRPMASSPRIITQTCNSAVRRRNFEEKPVSLFIVPPCAQASRRCETQATLTRQGLCR